MTLKAWLRYPLDIRRARLALANRAETEVARSPSSSWQHSPCVVIDLRTTDLTFDAGRHLAAIAQQAGELGASCVLRCSTRILATIARKSHGRRFLQSPIVSHLAPGDSLPLHTIVLTDVDPRDEITSDQHRSVWMRIGKTPESDLPVMPYPMHPATREHWPPANLDTLRHNGDRAEILFAGNQKATYGQGKIGKQFGLCDRLEMLSAIERHFPDRINRSLPNKTDKPITLLASRDVSIKSKDWLATLASHRFFLCCPGSSQPTCHHLVEAMSVGTIPILEYDQRITPALVNEKTAITFRGQSGLIEAIKRIDSLPESQLARMRENVFRFYDQHLCQNQFMRLLLDSNHNASEPEIPTQQVSSISLPFHHENFYSHPAHKNAA